MSISTVRDSVINVIRRLSGTSTRGALLLAVVFAPACAQTPESFSVNAGRLLRDNGPAADSDERFRPLTPEEMGSFALPEAMPYRLGIGDTVLVRALNAEIPGYEGGFRARIKADGKVRLPYLDKLVVVPDGGVGLTPIEFEDMLNSDESLDKISAKGEKGVVVDVEVADYGSQKFYVVGEVESPSTLPANGTSTLLETLIQVGGTKLATADLDEAYMIRDFQIMPFSISDIVRRGHPASQMVMHRNDLVFVPHLRDRTKFVYVMGEVANPSRIPMDLDRKGKGSRLTLAAAVAEAGGLNPRANINMISVFRGGWRCPSVFQLAICDVYRYGNDIQLRAGDRVAVGTSESAKFTDAIGPTLQIISGTTSALSLAFSAQALSK